MKRVIREKDTGKTQELMRYAVEHDATFLCANPVAMERKAREYGIFGLKAVQYEEPFIGEFVIDEIECFIRQMSDDNDNFIGYSLSIND